MSSWATVENRFSEFFRGDAMSEENGWTRGKLVVKKNVLPPIEIDFSDWIGDVPIEQWTKGTLVVKKRVLKPIEIDFSDWMTAPANLALTVHLGSSTDLAGCSLALLNLVDEINRLDRNLGGAGLNLESNRRANGTLILQLFPTDTKGAVERIRRIVDAINGATVITKPPEIESLHAVSA